VSPGNSVSSINNTNPIYKIRTKKAVQILCKHAIHADSLVHMLMPCVICTVHAHLIIIKALATSGSSWGNATPRYILGHIIPGTCYPARTRVLLTHLMHMPCMSCYVMSTHAYHNHMHSTHHHDSYMPCISNSCHLFPKHFYNSFPKHLYISFPKHVNMQSM
jgi:hypothetical protein